MSLNQIHCPSRPLTSVPTVSAKVPTKSRVEALLINSSPNYSIKLVIGLGIASTTCGIILCLFGVVIALIEVESTLTGLYCETSIGVWVILNGFIAIISGTRPHSWCQLYVYMLSSLITIGLTGALAILISNSVLHLSQSEDIYNYNEFKDIKNFDFLYNSSTLFISSLMLLFCVLAFIISIVSFVTSGRKVCQCYHQNNKFGHNFINDHNLDPDSMSKRDRIMQWIVQQSDLQLNRSHNVSYFETISYKSKKKLSNLNSTSTESTGLSAYDK